MTSREDDEIKNFIGYDALTGELAWTARPSRKVRIGDKVKRLNNGYLALGFRGRTYMAQRVAWFLETGSWPSPGMQVDHINGVRTDNSFANLRLATNAENSRNARGKKKSGLKGAYFHKDRNRWSAAIKINGRSKGLGYFKTEREAHEAYAAAAPIHHGKFARCA